MIHATPLWGSTIPVPLQRLSDWVPHGDEFYLAVLQPTLTSTSHLQGGLPLLSSSTTSVPSELYLS